MESLAYMVSATRALNAQSSAALRLSAPIPGVQERARTSTSSAQVAALFFVRAQCRAEATAATAPVRTPRRAIKINEWGSVDTKKQTCFDIITNLLHHNAPKMVHRIAICEHHHFPHSFCAMRFHKGQRNSSHQPPAHLSSLSPHVHSEKVAAR